MQTIEHRVCEIRALARLLFTIARRHTRRSALMIFFLMWRLLVAAPCGTSRATLCWLDVSGDRITQRHRRLVKTEHKASKVLASRGTVTIARSVASRRRIAPRSAALQRNKNDRLLNVISSFSLSSLFARYVTTRTRNSTISSNMAAFTQLSIASSISSRLFLRSNAMYTFVRVGYTARYISTDMYLRGKAQPVRFLTFALFMSDT